MNKQKKQLSKGSKRLLFLLAVLFAIVVGVTIYLFQRVHISDRKIFRLSFIALLLGLVLEYRRIAEKWIPVLWTALGAYLLSFSAFGRGRREGYYSFEAHLESWPWHFLGSFILIALIVHYRKLTVSITEGTTLLLTAAINYWLWANGYWQTDLLIVKLLLYINICFSVTALYHAFTYSHLGKGARLALSVWSSIILLILAIDHILYHYNYGDIENFPVLYDQIFIFLQYFLLGVSGIYIAHNISMIAAYLPGKYYRENVRKMNSLHIKRFSETQVRIKDATIVLLFSLSLFGVNAYFRLLPVNFIIWLTIGSAPFFLSGLQQFTNTRKQSSIIAARLKRVR